MKSGKRPLAHAAALVFLLAACDNAASHPGAKSPSAEGAAATGAQTTTTAADLARAGAQTPTVFGAGLAVSDAIASACGMQPRGQAKVASSHTNFDYDSAALAEEDRGILAEVARCLTDGALRGRAVTLVGRTDARGEPEYNMTLGESRADSVRRYMVDLGVGKDRMRSTSRGEIDATGTDEDGYRHDRRVELELAN